MSYKICPYSIFWPKNGGVMVVFSFLLLMPPRTSEALKKRFKFWILDLKVCLKKLGIGPGLYGKSVLYLWQTRHPQGRQACHS